ncbi:MAG: phosphoserine phosphatase SerB, partial [Fimbriimonadaceae bacterium]|nr:phosphoserine phosphatase SerB [Alphaproteobacteria bacterium]
MSHVLVLISNPETRSLGSDHVAAACSVLPAPAAPDWLNERIACQIPFDPQGQPIYDIKHRVKERLQDAPLDIAIVAAHNRRKKLLIADMDSTIIEQECIDEIADLLGLKKKVAAITERAMTGELPFVQALKERAALLVGVTRQQIDQIISERITFTPGAQTLVATMSHNGAFCALVSGGFTIFTAVIGAKLGFHETRANKLGFKDDALDGTVDEPILGPEAKLAALKEYSSRVANGPADAIAVGDGANDISMIRNTEM